MRNARNTVSHGRVLGSISALAAATLLAQPAFAQETTDGEIIVTATKREQALSDVPLAASAISGEALADSNAQSLGDYIARLPGVVFNDYQPGVSEVVIRGIAATTYHEQGQTTVGYYLNEIPLVEPGFPIGIPDVDTFDLNRVEVLRGPQGTLFGASSLGGLINYVVNTADATKFDAAASGLIGHTKNAGSDVNWAAKAMINAPIIPDLLAARVVAYQREEAGYLDNPGTGVNGSNDFRTRGLRGSLVLTPGVDTKVTFMSVWQDTDLEDQTYFDLEDPYIRDTGRPEPQTTEFWLNSLRLDQGLGDFGKLTVLGSLIDKENFTQFFYPYFYVTGVTTGLDGAYGVGNADAKIKTIEARLSGGTGAFSYLVGISHMVADKTSYDQIFQNGASDYIDANPALFDGYAGSVLAPNDRLYGYRSDTHNEDTGLFGELSFRPVEQIELIVGGRYFWNSFSADVLNQAGALGGYPGGFYPTDRSGSVSESENGFTPKVTVAFHPNADVMTYATYSKGYRVGGINPNAGLLPSIATAYDSDTVDNYEAGLKASLLDKRLYLDIAAFKIDWKDIQARLFGPAPSYYSYVTNAGGAEVKGVEFAGSYAFTRNATFSTSVTYQDAELTEFLPDTFAVGGGYAAGSTLPGSSKWSVANSLKVELADKPLRPMFEIAHRYLSKAPVAFGNDATRGDFNIIDLRFGITVADSVKVLAFANNLFDEYGVLNAPFTSSFAPAGSIVRPSTVGLRVDWSL